MTKTASGCQGVPGTRYRISRVMDRVPGILWRQDTRSGVARLHDRWPRRLRGD